MSKTTTGSPTIHHQIGPRGRLTVRQAAGELRIRGVEGDRVTVRADDDDVLGEEFAIERGDGFLELRQTTKLCFGIFGRGESVDLEIDVPHGATLLIEGQSVDIDASDLDGAKVFRTASGEVSLQRLAGAVEVETVSGDVAIDGGAPIDLRARTVSGDVEVRVPTLRRLDLTTTSADAEVDAELRGEGPFAIRTISGNVNVVCRSGFRVEAETITGELSSETPAKRESMPGRRVLTIGRPGPTLTFRSVSGDFHVTEAREPARAFEEEWTMINDAAPSAAEGTETSQAPAARADTAAVAASASDPDAARLEILRRLERGEISVAEAGDQLGALDEVAR